MKVRKSDPPTQLLQPRIRDLACGEVFWFSEYDVYYGGQPAVYMRVPFNRGWGVSLHGGNVIGASASMGDKVVTEVYPKAEVFLGPPASAAQKGS